MVTHHKVIHKMCAAEFVTEQGNNYYLINNYYTQCENKNNLNVSCFNLNFSSKLMSGNVCLK